MASSDNGDDGHHLCPGTVLSTLHTLFNLILTTDFQMKHEVGGREGRGGGVGDRQLALGWAVA